MAWDANAKKIAEVRSQIAEVKPPLHAAPAGPNGLARAIVFTSAI
jgi:hypothetical protein